MNTFNTAHVETAVAYGVTFTPEMTPELQAIQASEAYKVIVEQTAAFFEHFGETELAHLVRTGPAYSRAPMTVRQMALAMLMGAVTTETACGATPEATSDVGNIMFDMILEMHQAPATERENLQAYYDGLMPEARAYIVGVNMVDKMAEAAKPMAGELFDGLYENCKDVLAMVDTLDMNQR